MKQLKLKPIGLIALVLFLTAQFNLNAQGFRPQMHPSPPKMDERNAPNHKPEGPMIPNLSEEQKTEIRAFHVAMEKESLPIISDLKQKEAQFSSLLIAEKYDSKAVDKTIEEIGSLKTKLAKLKASNTQKIKSILNEEQLTFFNKQLVEHGPFPEKRLR